MADFVRVASLAALPPGTIEAIEVQGQDLCLVNADGAVYAIRDRCSHAEHPLSTGSLENGRLECSWHGAQFDPATGRAVRLPAVRPVTTFEVRIEGDDILVAI